ncbi:MAG TPA: phosphate signaling complex protein PhoU [Euryarchaeota archaeon]|nr:phosphate signaling complex protein PhoU [Euryarchaeota archaeon]
MGKFHNDLKLLKDEVEKMGKLSSSMLRDSITALENLDQDMAESVIMRKEELLRYDSEVEERALEILTLYQPMAKDMRKLATILKLDTYLARIGRYGYDIARVTKDLCCQPHIGKLVSIPHMADIVKGMIEDALTAFKEENTCCIDDLEERDDKVDALRHSIFRESVSYMMEDPKHITRCSHYIMIARYLERCADHACKMGEKIHYMVTGERKEIR